MSPVTIAAPRRYAEPASTDLRLAVRPRKGGEARERDFRADIEGLRAVAITLVVAFHAAPGVVPGGYVGVDVFFVLSGFLITGLLVDELRRTGTISLSGFYARRVRRLLPLSTVVLIVTSALAYWLLPPLDRASVAGDVRSAALYFANWHFAAGSTQYMASTDKSVVLHYWSLAVEEQFYLVWPLLLLLVAGRRGIARRRWDIALRRIVLGLAVLATVSLALSVRLTESAGPWAYFGLHTRAWELAAGAALALARPALPAVPRRIAALGAAAGLLLIVSSAFAFDAMTAFPGTAAMLPITGTVLLVACGVAAGNIGASRALRTPVPMYVGRVSYAWYLWHWPLLVLLAGSTNGAGPSGDAAVRAASPLRVLSVVALSFALAVASHYAVERPVRAARWLAVPVRRSLALGAALTTTSVVVAALVLGHPWALNGSNGVMTAAEARADLPKAPPGCYVGPSGRTPGADCLIGDRAGTRTVVLVGDSKAAQWIPALDRTGKERHWKVYVWVKAFCPFADVQIWSPTERAEYTACTAWRTAVMSRLVALGPIDLLVLGRSSGYTNRLLEPGGGLTSANDIQAVWTRAVEDTVRQLHATGARFAVLRETPWPTRDIPACLSEGSGSGGHRCDFDRANRVARDAAFARGEEAARGTDGSAAVTEVDLNDAICAGVRCPVVSAGGMVLYRDDQHITATYAASLADELGQRLDAVLRG